MEITNGTTMTHIRTTVEVEVQNFLLKNKRAKLEDVLSHFKNYNATQVETYYNDFKKEKNKNIKTNILLAGFFLLCAEAIFGIINTIAFLSILVAI